MSLFPVSGWDAPSSPIALNSNSKKRKRETVAEEDAKIRTATANIERLMRQLDTGSAHPENPERGGRKDINKDSENRIGGKGKSTDKKRKGEGQTKDIEKRNKVQDTKKNKAEKEKGKTPDRSKKKKRVDVGDGHAPVASLLTSTPATDESDGKAIQSAKEKGTRAPSGLTALQNNMKASLEGARFRYARSLLF
jgi:ribosomal RNA-processing protein 8